MGFATPMMAGAMDSLVVSIVAVYLGPETKGMVMTAEPDVIEAEITLG
jgi:SHS family lactate transporter-like MFS transporter